MSTAAATPIGTSTPPAALHVRITRFLRAPRERVFAAWTDPEQLKQWMGPAGFTCRAAESDPRAGGRHHLVMHGPSSNCAPGETPVTRETSTTGEYLEVRPPELIRFTWNPDFFPGEHTIVTIRLKQVAGGTELELFHEGFVNPDVAAGHNKGWNGSLDKLAALIER
ncbi:MAG TPA: SRPBCC domain-containing protein [Acidobacteriaceae bacterium]|nr:SRPBCC domain-containing protein [Acidobacteriaceae bacterium]